MAESGPHPAQPPSQAQYDRFLELKKHRDQIATEVQLDPSLIAAKAVLESLAFRPDEALPKLLLAARTPQSVAAKGTRRAEMFQSPA